MAGRARRHACQLALFGADPAAGRPIWPVTGSAASAPRHAGRRGRAPPPPGPRDKGHAPRGSVLRRAPARCRSLARSPRRRGAPDDPHWRRTLDRGSCSRQASRMASETWRGEGDDRKAQCLAGARDRGPPGGHGREKPFPSNPVPTAAPRTAKRGPGAAAGGNRRSHAPHSGPRGQAGPSPGPSRSMNPT
jgi:hypothetical protein